MSEPTKAVFLSYASQDKEAAAKICDALRAAGVEVWFDQSELRGGDAWDAMIRKRIKECALFVPLITPTTNARAEGYFRLEWKLAVDRSHLLADDHPFLFPIVMGDVTDATARVPDKFRDVQWTRLRLDETPSELGARVAKLLSGGAGASLDDARGRRPAAPLHSKPISHWMRNLGMAVGLLIGLVYALRPLWAPARRSEPKPAAVAPAAPVAPAPVSAARQLAEKARALFDKIDSNADDYAVAESLLKRALELDATDGVIWAYSARLNAAYLTRSFERGTARAETARNHAERAVKLAPESAEAWHALGRAIWRSDPPRAEEALRHALQLAPDDGRILISLGSIYRNQGRDEDALAFYVRAAAQPDVKALALYDQFLIHLYLRRFAEADRCGREAGAILPTTNSITGLALLEIVWHGRVDAAQRTLDAAPAAMRSEPRTVFTAALAALMAKQSDEALRALDRLPGDFINDGWYSGPKALFVGLAHAQAGRAEAARTAWESGLAVVRRRLQEASNDPELHLRLGELLAWTGQAEPALHEARVFEELARTRTDWTFSSARIYAALGRADEARPILEKFLTATATGRWPLTPALLRLDPIWDKLRGDARFQKLCEDPAAPAVKAPLSEGAQLAARALALYTKVGFTRDDLAPAEDLARRATEREPDSAATWGVRAGVQAAWLFRGWDVSDQRRQDTQTLANRALALDPNEPEALLALGHVLRSQGAFDQSVAHLRRAVAANPDHVRLTRALGYTLGQAGRNAESRAVLQDIVQRVPRDPLLRYEHALTYGSYGSGGANPENLAAALEELDAAIALQPFSSALILKAALLGGWRADLPAMRAVLDLQDKLPVGERSEDRSVCVAMWAGLLEHRPDRVEAAAALTARNYFDDLVMPMRPKAWSLALAHRLAGKENLARNDWQSAAAVLRARLKDEPANNIYKVELAVTLAWLDQREEAARLIGEVEPLLQEQPTIWGARMLAFYYTALGDAARAVPYLRSRLDENVFTSRKVLPLDPAWDKIRGSPEFAALLQPPSAVAFTLAPKVDDKSVAVLAFANLSDDKANEYFSDGISEELLNVLAKVPGLKVSARTSAFHFKGKDTPIPEIAQQLGVAYVVEGSVRKQGDRVRITAQLIKAADGFHVWSDTFTRDLKDIFAVQDEIAGLIAKNLSLKLGVSSTANSVTLNPEAFELYVRGRQAWNQRKTEGYEQAELLFNQALALAPGFVRARAALADIALLRADGARTTGHFGQHDTPEIRRLIQQIRDVLALEPDLAEAHASLGLALTQNWDWAESERELRRATALNPNYATGHQWLGNLLAYRGDIDGALAELKLASEIDPLSHRILDTYGDTLGAAGRIREALIFQDRALAVQPDSGQALCQKAYWLAASGRFPEAVALARKLPAKYPYSLPTQIIVFGQSGLQAEAEALLPKADKRTVYHFSLLLLAVGHREAALAALADTASASYSDIAFIFYDPSYDGIRADPRFAKFLATLGLTEAHTRAQAWRAAHPSEKPEAVK